VSNNPNQSNQTASSPDNATTAKSADSLTRKQEEKLTLEIEDLRKRNRWSPIVATLLGVAGFFFTVLQFQCQRSSELQRDRVGKEVDQLARFQNQTRTDIDEILRSAHEEGPSAARVLFLVEDMKTVMESKVNDTQKFSAKFPNYERGLTKGLAILIRDDYDFSHKPRDVSRANVVRGHWNDYSNYLREDARMLDYILYKYTQALQNFRDRNIGYVECLTVDPQTQQVQVCRKYELQQNDQALYDYFADLIKGFKQHIELVGGNPLTEVDQKRRNKILLDFQEAICNPVVSKHYSGVFFPGESCIPRH
jgi:hypothetical protein